MSLIKSYSVPAKVIRCIAVLNVVAAIGMVFLIGYDFPFQMWLIVLIASLLGAVITYGFAIVIDAAYIYIQKNVPQEEEYDYTYTPSDSSNIVVENSSSKDNDSLYDDIINNG